MTQSQLTERYLSDTKSVHEAHERGIIDDVQYEQWIEKLDREFFHEVEFAPSLVPATPQV